MDERKDICKVEEKPSDNKYAMVLSRLFMTVVILSASSCIVALAVYFIMWLFGL